MSALPYKINERVFERIAMVSTLSVPGTTKQDAKLAGLAGRSLPQFTATIDRQGGVVHFDAEVAIAFPSPAKAVVQEVRETISRRVEDMTGFRVSRININIASFVAEDSGFKITREIVANHRRQVPVSGVTVPQLRVSSPSVKPSPTLSSISIAPPKQVSSVETPRPHEVVTAGFLDDVPELEIRTVDMPAPLRLSTIRTPQPADLTPVSTPEAAPLTPISTKPLPEVDITVVPFVPPQVQVPEVPALKELTPITTSPIGGTR